ncbi:hypothetical protein JGH11_03045 [Dysgonomonas sp. Marseille-P4677]|uniref:hypothetical protein n=1 Tax=Dysgonomonas sp. Marseille-P4677 TaxID=2364790 RepID=UPI001911F126|nr:hypothetical protein [Dysgonomonas sp. Marseille-P4677]MBK5719843.1 hypothetical protein [Dysgonomonas sp. Marseille-P4677]
MKTKLTSLLLLFACYGLFAQTSKAPSKDELIKALNECATYTSTILLDEEGKSRCDYNTIERKWYPYEEPWHTGQLIFGLLEAYKVTKNKETLCSAWLWKE